MEKNAIHFFRNLFVAFALGIPMAALTSCGDDAEGRASINDAAPDQVTNVSSTAGPGEVYLTWTIPSSSSFMYSKVTYKNSRGEEVYQLYSKDHADEHGVMNATISGFVSTEPVEFNIYACSVRGKSRNAVTYNGTPGAPAFLAVANSITVEPTWGGVNVGYTNDTQATVYVDVAWTDAADASKGGSIKITAGPNSQSQQFVNLFTSDSEFINGTAAKVTAAAQDADGNSADPKSFTVTPKAVVALDRSGWSFPGYQDKNDATIGYSSQEAGGEGASPKGRVIAMIDGDENTFWHTAWKTSSAYPHFFIIDMGAEYEVSNVAIRRRGGNNGTNIGQTFFTCSEANATGSDPEGWNWTNQGWYSFDRNSNRHQRYAMKQVEKARYIKVYYSTADKGGNFVMVSEFNAYTPAN